MDLEVEFKADGEYTSSGDYTINLTIDFDGQTSTTAWTNSGFMGNGTWEQTGNEILTIDSTDFIAAK